MLIPVILSGGAGTRLWPASREAAPKPFLTLPDGQSLLHKTLVRALKLPHVHSVATITNREYFFSTQDTYTKIKPHAKLHYLLEPVGRNTAPAIAMAALALQAEYGDDACLLILPADHLIQNEGAFADAVTGAYAAAQTGQLVTFGIAPTHAETGFGYIRVEEKASLNQATPVASFVEKPDLAKAQAFVADGRYFWNSGMFCFGAGAFLQALKAAQPHLYDACLACWQASAQESHPITFDVSTFAQLDDISVDYAVMEHAKNVMVIPCNIGWNDIGSWNALADLTAADSEGNRTIGESILVDSRDCYIQTEERLVAMVGVDSLVVVDTPDALLIAHKDKVQDVKSVVKTLKANNHEAYKLHRTVHRPWGTYTVLEEGERFKMKRIVVKPGATLSLQMHYHRSEHWIVVSGTAIVVNGEQEILLRANESTYIPAGEKHRLQNPGVLDLVLIEVQCGDYLGEDDIVRFEDKYGRA